MKPAWQFGSALIAMVLSTSCQATDAGIAQFRAEIQQFVDRLATSSDGALKWAGSDPYEIRRDGDALVVVIRHARLAVRSTYLSGEIALGPIAIWRTIQPGGKTSDFAVRLPSEVTFQGPGPTGPSVLGKITLKDAKADIVIETQSGFTRASSLSAAGGQIDMPTTGAWIRFGRLSTASKIVAEPNGGWVGPTDFELRQVEFVSPLGVVGGVIERIAYQGKSAGPKLAAFDQLRLALSKLRNDSPAGRKPDVASLLATLRSLPEALGSFGADLAVEGIAVRNATGEALGSLKKAEFAVKVAGLDGKAASLRLTLGEDGLSVPPSLAHGAPVPSRIAIDVGLGNLSNEALHAVLDAAAATTLGGQPSEQQEQQERQQLLAAAAKFEPVFRIYDIGVDTKDVGLDLSGQASGSPLGPKGYSAAGDLVVRGFDAIASLHPPPALDQYLPLLRTMAISEKTPDGAERLRFHLASDAKHRITINGNDVSAWFFQQSGTFRIECHGNECRSWETPQEPGQPRLLRLVYPPLEGADVKRVQQALAVAKITVPENGVYGGATAAAVARFQKEKGLNVSGVVDAATRQQLGFAPEPAGPAPMTGSPRMPAAPNEAQRRPPAAPNAAAESGVSGVWTAYDVGFPPWTLTLKADGARLRGTVQQGVRGSSAYTALAMPAAIYDGEIDGNKITFKCQDPWLHERTITFTGIVNGGAITFTRTVLVKPGGRPGGNGIFGASGAAAFTAQRVVPPARDPDQRRADLGEVRFVNIDISGVANSELDWLQRAPRGHVTFDGIPFTILSGDRAVIHMHNRVRADYPSTLRFPIGAASVASLHLLLCGDWISSPGQHVGTVRISYSDGSSREVPLISLDDIRETWMPNFSLPGHPSPRPPEGVTWNVAYSESQMRGGMASTAFLDRLSIRTDPARTINDVSFLTNEPQTGMILIAMTLEIAPGAVPFGAASAPAKRD
jgi:peptidoglycan hydrolase-like protein with peptidoglycan-binding domain